jgi:hypothetical protein
VTRELRAGPAYVTPANAGVQGRGEGLSGQDVALLDARFREHDKTDARAHDRMTSNRLIS